eukprot:gnl/TRDRNA2_/TRDRNA2_203323_c0_seq1.p1 gnl/TRDRNA2_/TRDRNA2_203323_c0~~gnl/TRDRNA2_/TRDRNA2_203323_c0_seq1.p1  ORF type:complete len:239 (-),score=34.05 gnl/TRDRNA2_/TRDRNA2_203323_c0_seq1:5-721(-)
MAWAFAKLGEPVPSMLDPPAVLDAAEPQLAHYQMSVQSLAGTGQILSAFTVLGQAEARGLLSRENDRCYDIFRMLREACCVIGDSERACWVQESVERLGLIALAPLAWVCVQGSQRQCEKGVCGEGIAEGRKLYLELCTRMSYSPQLQALPWVFSQSSTWKQQEMSLQLHPEKKALAMLLIHGEAQLTVSIEFHACVDCHELFKRSSLLLGRSIHLYQTRLSHTFADDRCSCSDRWRW